MLEYISNYLDPALYHRFFYFLSTDAGILFERSVEVVIYLILLYMVISEYLRSRKDELKYFILAFASILFLRIVSVMVMANVVFGNLNSSMLNTQFPVVVHFIEVLTLIFLINAFLYPVFSKKLKKLGHAIILEIGLLVVISGLVEFLWIIAQTSDADVKFQAWTGNILFIAVEIAVIISALVIIFWSKKELMKHRHKLFIAFFIYMLAPIIEAVNAVFFGYANPRLLIIEFPIPLIAIMFFTEVTYLKLVDKAYLKEQLKESERKYQSEKELGKMKDDFVSVVSHELRTPITSMKLYCGLMHKGKFGKISQKQHQAIHIMESEMDRLNNLVNDVLNLSKMESGKEKIELEEFGLDELRTQIVNNTAGEKGVRLVFDIPKGFKARVDKRKFIQLYTNIFGNAVKFTEKGGRIRVQVDDLGSRWSLSISDSGRGIPEDEIPKLFDKFYQVESHMTRSVGGTGLGLAIVRSIVDLHKGVIEVKSQPGKGSEFKIYFAK